ncbi:MAG: phosphohistidine phosphatase [Arenicella sp.]|jgi:phosphohistidine phosphatase
MKTLYLFRHAKSCWEDASLDDFDRPLNKRGKRDAPMMAKRLLEKEILPDLILSSSAKRAGKTARKVAKGIGYPKKEIEYKRAIYDSDEEDLLQLINSISDTYESIMLFGHNPEFTGFANELTNEVIDNIPTSGVVCIEFDVENWAEIEMGKGKLLFFDYPKSGREEE